MKTPLTAASVASLLLLSSFAYAQDDAPIAPLPPAPPPPVVVVPAPQPVYVSPPAAPPAPAAAVGECSLGSHAGVDEADAHTAAEIVCAEVSHRGMHVGAHYRVGIGKLGSSVVLSLTMETAPGVIAEHRQIELTGIEEVPVAAPRLADAVNRGEAIEDTQRVGNVVHSEARPPLTKKGDIHFSLGIVAIMPPFGSSGGGTPAPGIDMGIHYEWTNFAIGVGFRAGGGSDSNDSTSLGYVGLTVGGRYYLSDGDIAPFLGGGLAWTYLNASTGSFDGSNSGVGAFGEIGVTALRTHHSHLSLGVRADLPFYSLSTNATFNAATSEGYYGSSPSSLYYVPITVNATFTF